MGMGMFAGNVTLVIMETIMFINEQYDFDWSEDYEQAFYSDKMCNRFLDCCFTWDNL